MGPLGIRRPPEWGVDPTPETVRILRTFDLFVFWSSLAVGLLVLIAGSLLVITYNLTLWETVVVAFVGSLIGALVLAGAGVFGSKYGVPMMVGLRPILGTKGSWVPSAVNIFQLVGWTSFELYVMGFAATAISGAFLGGYTIPFWIIIFSIVVVVLALGGPIAVIKTWLEKVAIWLILISMVVVGYFIFAHPTNPFSWGTRAQPGGSGSLLLAIDLVIAMPISWWPLISDFNRFAKNRMSAAVGTISGYTFANFLFYFLGAALILATGAVDAIAGIAMLGLGSFVLLLILVDETDNAFADVYSAALSFQNIRKKTKQLSVIVVATIISLGVAIYLSGTNELVTFGYENFLLMIGALFVPLLGIVLADFWLVRKGNYSIGEFYGKSPRVRWRPFAAWIPGIILYYGLSPSLVQALFPSFQGLPYTIGASVPSFVLSALLYTVLSKLPLHARVIAPSPNHAGPAARGAAKPGD